jgi:hypothetical protein
LVVEIENSLREMCGVAPRGEEKIVGNVCVFMCLCVILMENG